MNECFICKLSNCITRQSPCYCQWVIEELILMENKVVEQ
jgi:hypothetical protein